MPKLRQLQTAYIDLEQKIAAKWPKSFSNTCCDCVNVCCRPHMAQEVLDSFWLTSISTIHHGKWWQQETNNPLCPALTDVGCLLKVGKPPFCYSFYCDSLLEHHSAYDLVASLFLSNILTALCKLDRKRNLLDLSRIEIIESEALIAQRIKNGLKHFELFIKYNACEPDARPALAFEMVVEMPNLLTASVRKALLKTL